MFPMDNFGLLQELEKLRNELKAKQSHIDRTNARCRCLEDDASSLQRKHQAASNEISALLQQLEQSRGASQLQTEELKKRSEEISHLKRRLNSHDIDASSSRSRREKMENENAHLTHQISRHVAAHESLQSELKSLQQQKDSLQAVLTHKQLLYDKLQHELDQQNSGHLADIRRLHGIVETLQHTDDKEIPRSVLILALKKSHEEQQNLKQQLDSANQKITTLHIDASLITSSSLSPSFPSLLSPPMPHSSRKSLCLSSSTPLQTPTEETEMKAQLKKAQRELEITGEKLQKMNEAVDTAEEGLTHEKARRELLERRIEATDTRTQSVTKELQQSKKALEQLEISSFDEKQTLLKQIHSIEADLHQEKQLRIIADKRTALLETQAQQVAEAHSLLASTTDSDHSLLERQIEKQQQDIHDLEDALEKTRAEAQLNQNTLCRTQGSLDETLTALQQSKLEAKVQLETIIHEMQEEAQEALLELTQALGLQFEEMKKVITDECDLLISSLTSQHETEKQGLLHDLRQLKDRLSVLEDAYNTDMSSLQTINEDLQQQLEDANQTLFRFRKEHHLSKITVEAQLETLKDERHCLSEELNQRSLELQDKASSVVHLSFELALLRTQLQQENERQQEEQKAGNHALPSQLENFVGSVFEKTILVRKAIATFKIVPELVESIDSMVEIQSLTDLHSIDEKMSCIYSQLAGLVPFLLTVSSELSRSRKTAADLRLADQSTAAQIKQFKQEASVLRQKLMELQVETEHQQLERRLGVSSLSSLTLGESNSFNPLDGKKRDPKHTQSSVATIVSSIEDGRVLLKRHLEREIEFHRQAKRQIVAMEGMIDTLRSEVSVLSAASHFTTGSSSHLPEIIEKSLCDLQTRETLSSGLSDIFRSFVCQILSEREALQQNLQQQLMEKQMISSRLTMACDLLGRLPIHEASSFSSISQPTRLLAGFEGILHQLEETVEEGDKENVPPIDFVSFACCNPTADKGIFSMLSDTVDPINIQNSPQPLTVSVALSDYPSPSTSPTLKRKRVVEGERPLVDSFGKSNKDREQQALSASAHIGPAETEIPFPQTVGALHKNQSCPAELKENTGNSPLSSPISKRHRVANLKDREKSPSREARYKDRDRALVLLNI